ncbi:AraC family transcriptional regulator [Paenibacillus flagellatus]|uniref:HTH araC/xylS-type domain-containing protein n=1 Tax=Paenibacillus flagellatus TaxID=2211139 RepID=A0A2V5KAI6_9BACL|nr:AraC family transcriptional regulator [Paenibacillus flagellatus]PYI56591.1 hypothetical protein DLM86_06380 [Paenibacillus flagellatus]
MSDIDDFRDVTLHYAGTEEAASSGGEAGPLPFDTAAFGFVLKHAATIRVAIGEGEPQSRRVEAGEWICIPPGSRCVFKREDGRAFRVVLIRFRARLRNGEDASSWPVPSDGTGGGWPLVTFRLPQASGWLADFTNDADGRVSRDPAGYYRLQSHLYAIASACAATARKPRSPEDELVRYVDRAKRHMHVRYAEPADMEETAKLSGASASRFYELFREQTGLSPHKYRTTIRLNESLRLLANSRIPVMEVAHAVGYADELYFSKLFKRHMGLTPTEYAARARKKIVIPPIFAGDLAVLGVTPELVLDKGWSERPERYMELIERSRPELILTSPISDDLYRTLSGIAPVVPLAWKSCPWRQRLLQIGGLLDMPSVAERWLAFFERKASNARYHIERQLGKEPYLIVNADGGSFRVFGMRMKKMKDLFYDDLGVTPPDAAADFDFVDADSLDGVAAIGCGNALFLVPSGHPDEYGDELEERWRQCRGSAARTLVVRYEGPLLYNAAMHAGLIDGTVSRLLRLAK